jgi:hypothetical protein
VPAANCSAGAVIFRFSRRLEPSTGVVVNKASEEYKYRQIGLAVSIGFIWLLMLAIYLKLRQMEK